MSKASQKAVCDYSFHCIVTDLGGTQLEEMNALVGEGVTSFKLFMAYPGVFMLDDASIFKALAIALAEMAGAPVYIVHLTCNDALEKVREARDRGLPVYAETCPQYLYLSIENFDAPGFEGAKYVFTPPLREKWHQEKLWNGLAKDDLQLVSTDHCPFCYKEQKELGRDDFTKIPNGGPGIEHRLALVYSGGVVSGR